MIEAVISDLNGVFITSEPLSKRFEKKFEVPVSDFLPVLSEIMDRARRPNSPNIFSLWKPYLEKWKVKLGEDEFLNFWFSGEQVDHRLIDYASELRKSGMKVFTLSNNFRERTIYYRQNFPEVFENINKAYFSWESGLVKPDPRAYQKLLDNNGLKGEECIYFDDSDKNIEAAKSLGIQAKKYDGVEAMKDIVERSELH